MSGFRTEADASVSAAATMTTAMDEKQQNFARPAGGAQHYRAACPVELPRLVG